MDSPSRPSTFASSLARQGAAAVPAAPPISLLTPAFVQLLLVQLSFGLSFSTYFLLPKYLAKELAADARTIGAAAAMPLVAGVLASPAIGLALDRFGRRSSLLLGAWLGVLTSVAMSVVTEVGPFLYAVRAVQGVGFALVFNAASALAADRAPPARLGHAMGLVGAASLVTNAIGPGLAEMGADTWGWEPVFLATSAMSLLTFVLSLGVTDSERIPDAHTSAVPREGFRLGWVAAVTGAAFGTLMTFTQPQAIALGADRVAGFFVGYTVAALLVRIGLGGLADRIGRWRVARATLFFYGLVTIATALVRPGLLELFGFAFGIAHGLLYPALAAIVAERSHPARRGRALTGLNAAFNGGCGASLLLSGFVADWTGYAVVFVGVGLVTASTALTFPSQPPARTAYP